MPEHNHILFVQFSLDGKSAVLTNQICYKTLGRHFIVPKGFRTDFASIPRVLRRMYPKLDTHIRAAVLHDYLYQSGMLSRKDADRAFLDVMRQHGVPAWKRYSMYYGVRACGWYAYNKYRKNEQYRTI